MQEGVIQFQALHDESALAEPLFETRYQEPTKTLSAWREVFVDLGVLGQDPARYEGYGFGNMSIRVGPFPGSLKRRAFLVTGTQTGKLRKLRPRDCCVVTDYDIGLNKVKSFGPILPSSESLTHGAIYDLGPQIRAVVHVHAPELFHAKQLRLPTTAENVGYGTQAMANEVRRLFRATSGEGGVFIMAGHEDGVVSFGKSLEQASELMIRAIVNAKRPA